MGFLDLLSRRPKRGTLDQAVALARKVHAGQEDKGGAPYIEHPLRVMKGVDREHDKIAAVLHDVVEDGGVSFEALRAAGFSRAVVAAVDALTRRAGEDYQAFVVRAAANRIARRVKIQDILDNCDLSRIPEPAAADFERLIKYRRALSVLAPRRDNWTWEGEDVRTLRAPGTFTVVAEAVFPCRVCDTEAGRVKLVCDDDGLTVSVWCFAGSVEGGPDLKPERAVLIRSALARVDVRALFELDRAWTPFYCPECDACYCSAHWDHWDQSDAEDSTWIDGTKGRCPKGHERWLA